MAALDAGAMAFVSKRELPHMLLPILDRLPKATRCERHPAGRRRQGRALRAARGARRPGRASPSRRIRRGRAAPGAEAALRRDPARRAPAEHGRLRGRRGDPQPRAHAPHADHLHERERGPPPPAARGADGRGLPAQAAHARRGALESARLPCHANSFRPALPGARRLGRCGRRVHRRRPCPGRRRGDHRHARSTAARFSPAWAPPSAAGCDSWMRSRRWRPSWSAACRSGRRSSR